MAKGFKARGLKGGNSNTGPSIDYKALFDQVDEGTQGARVSVMVDLGMHKESMALSDKGQTGFLTEEEAQQWISEMKEKYGKKHTVFKDGDPDVEYSEDVEIGQYTKTVQLEDDGTWTVIEDDPEFIVEANEFGGEREYQELAIFADLTENYVDYGEEIGEKPFRVLLNPKWMGDIKGFQLKKSKPAQKDGVWTVKGNTKLAELASATGHKELLEVDLEEADWSELLGEAFNVAIEKSGDEKQYLNVGKCVGLKKTRDKVTKQVSVEEVEDLEHEAVLITFEDATLEDLQLAHLRGDVIKKIKQATDYAGSQMEVAIKQYEEYLKEKYSANSEESEPEPEVEEKSKRKVNKVGKGETASKAKGKAKPKDEPVNDNDSDDDSDDEGNGEDWGD